MILRLAAILVGLLAGVEASRADSVGEGRLLFDTHCARCHGTIEERQAAHRPAAWRLLPAFVLPHGPNLTGVYGRPAGGVAGFRYSNAFMQTLRGQRWTSDLLDRWLTDSQKLVPGSYMFIRLDPATRARIIEYLSAFARHDNGRPG